MDRCLHITFAGGHQGKDGEFGVALRLPGVDDHGNARRADDWSTFARPLSSGTPPPGVLHGGFYTRFAIVLPRISLIVSAAAQSKVVDRALATRRPRLHVVKL